MQALGDRLTGRRARTHHLCSMGAALREEAYRGTSGSHDWVGEHFRKRKLLCSDLESEWGTNSGSPEFKLGGLFRRAAELRNPRPVSGLGPGGRCFDTDSTGTGNPERADVSAEAPSGFSSCGVGNSRNLCDRSRNLCVVWSCVWSWGGVERRCASKATSKRT